MSFLSDIVKGAGSLISTVSGFLGSNSLGSNIVKTVLTGYALNKVTSSINKENARETSRAESTPTPDSGQKLQIPPAGENRIPVIYGNALSGGIITDVKMSADNQTMWFVVTICEVTGTLMSDGKPSEFTFEDVYYNGNRVIFNSNGITASYSMDADGNVDRSINGLVEVYCYANGSETPVVPDNYTNGSLSNAYALMPGWTSNHMMSDLVFALVKVTYNRDKGVTGMPNMSFDIRNSMTLPGDCLFDYMTSTRYGAGIDPTEIKDV
jgi:hypothetical protein